MKITVKNYEVAKELKQALQLTEEVEITEIGDKCIKYQTSRDSVVYVLIGENGVETFDSEIINQARAELKLSPIVTPPAPVVKPKMNVMELYALSCDKEKIMSAILKGAENATVDADKITIGKLNVALLWIDQEMKDKDRCEMTKKVITKARQYLGLQAKNPVAIGDKSTGDISQEELNYLNNCRREYEKTHKSADIPIAQGTDFLIADTTAVDAFTVIRYLTNDDTFRFEKIDRVVTLFINKARNLAIKVYTQEGNSIPLTKQDISAKRIFRIALAKIEGDVFTALATFNIDRKKPRVIFDYESIHKIQAKMGLPIVDYKPVEYGAPIVIYENAKGLEVKFGAVAHWKVEKEINAGIAKMDKKLFRGAFRIVFTLNNNRRVTWQNVNDESYLVDDSGDYLNVNGNACIYCHDCIFNSQGGLTLPESPAMEKRTKIYPDDNSLYRHGGCVALNANDRIFKIELIPVINAEIELTPSENAEIETVKYNDYSAEIEKMRAAYAVDDLKKRSAALAHIWQRDIAKKAGFGNNAKAGEVKAHFGITKKATLEEIISALSNSPSNAPASPTAPVNEPLDTNTNESQNAPVVTVDAEIANATAPAVVLFIADVPRNPEYYGITTKITKKGNTSWFINGEYVREGDAKSKLNALIQAATNKTIEGQIKGYIASIRRCVDRAVSEYNYALKHVAEYSMHVVNSINSARYLANNPFGVKEVDNCRGLAGDWWYYNCYLNELVYFVIEEKDTISQIAKMREQLDALISEYPQVAAFINDIGDVDAAVAKFDALHEKINNLPTMLYDNFNLMLQLTNCAPAVDTPAVDAPAEVPVNTPVILLPPPKSESIDAAALETNALSKINAYVRDVNAANSRIAMHSRARVIDNAIADVKAAALQIALKEARDLNLIIAGLNTLIVRIEEAAQQLDCDENAISYTLNRGYSLNTLENVDYRNSQSLYDATYSDFDYTAKFYDLLNIYDTLRRAREIVSNNEIDAAITDFENFAPPSDWAIAEIANYYFEHAADNAPESPTTPSNEPVDTNPSTDNEPPATSPTAPDSLIKQIGSDHAAAITAMLAANQTPVASLVNDYLDRVKFADSNGVGKKRNCVGFYLPEEKTISLDINADAKKHYATFFHEVAHMIDDLNGSGDCDEFFTGFNKNLEAAAVDDCNAIAENPSLRESLNSDLDSLRGLLNSGFDSLRELLNFDFDSLQNGCTRYALIDIIAMASDGKLFEYRKGHNRKYARHINFYRVHFNLVTEIFAELTAAAICEPNNLPIIHKYLPRTLDAYYQTVDAISANPK